MCGDSNDLYKWSTIRQSMRIINETTKTAPDACTSCGGALFALPSSTTRVRVAPYIYYQCQVCQDVFPTKERRDMRLVWLFDRLFDILGGAVCRCDNPDCVHGDGPCTVSDRRCLQADHIGGEGYSHRFGDDKNRRKAYEFYVAHPDLARAELRVLCANCNWIKRAREEECSPRAKRKARNSARQSKALQ